MPYLKIQTNVKVAEKEIPEILRSASKLIASKLGKPEDYVMVQLIPGQFLIFARNDDPCAFVELKSLGLSEHQGDVLSDTICGFLQESLKISPARIYIEMASHPPKLWGWNSETFR
jgi:phenylpyruvate tautomerase PptA (4-oxalocrotonate tautomerase family)